MSRLYTSLDGRLFPAWIEASRPAHINIVPEPTARSVARYRQRVAYALLSSSQKAVLDAAYELRREPFSIPKLTAFLQGRPDAGEVHREKVRAAVLLFTQLGFLETDADDTLVGRFSFAAEDDAALVEESAP